VSRRLPPPHRVVCVRVCVWCTIIHFFFFYVTKRVAHSLESGIDVELTFVVLVRRQRDEDDEDEDERGGASTTTRKKSVHRVRDEGNGAMEERSAGRMSVQRVRRAISATGKEKRRRRHPPPPLWREEKQKRPPPRERKEKVSRRNRGEGKEEYY